MKFVSFSEEGVSGLGICRDDGSLFGYTERESGYPGPLMALLSREADDLTSVCKVLLSGREFDHEAIKYAPPLSTPGKILCVGLNYRDHAAETGFEVPVHPTIFARYPSSLIGNGQPLVAPYDSTCLDYEGEFVVVIGKAGRRIPRERALEYVAGYSLFNDGSVRDVQVRTPQWTLGKNFDGTGAFGPYMVTAKSLPEGCRGLRLVTRLNGQVVQSASTDDLIFDVATLISLLSDVLTLVPGDIIVTGTPPGIGAARKPPLFLKPGDVCEVELEGVGKLTNPIVAETERFSD